MSFNTNCNWVHLITGCATEIARKKSKDSAELEHQRILTAARQRKFKDRMSEEQLEKKRQRDQERYYRLKQENKIKTVSQMNKNELKEQRSKLRNKKAKLKERKEEEQQQSEDNTSEEENQAEKESRLKRAGRKLVGREKSKVYRDLKKEKEETLLLKRKLEKYKNVSKGKKRKTRKIFVPLHQEKN